MLKINHFGLIRSMFEVYWPSWVSQQVKKKYLLRVGALPDCALILTKWHMVKGQPFWHWAVFLQEGDTLYVLDSKKG